MYTKGKKVENLYRLFLHMYKYILSVMGKYTDLYLSQTYLKEKLVINFDDKDDEWNIKKLDFISIFRSTIKFYLSCLDN